MPLIAVHLFVFYFGILADDTPPVGLAAFAAAAISKGDPIMTGVQGFAYDIRTALLPFLFIFNTELLLIDVSVPKAFFVFFVAVIAMMLFASATQGFMFTRNKIWESVLLLLIAFTLFRPGFWLDRVQPPFDVLPSSEVFEVVDNMEPGSVMNLVVSGPDFDSGEIESTMILVELGEAGDPADRLNNAGLGVTIDADKALIEEPFPGTPFFEGIGKAFDFYGDEPVQIAELRRPAERMPKEVFYIPAVVLLALVILLQKRRARQEQDTGAPEPA